MLIISMQKRPKELVPGARCVFLEVEDGDDVLNIVEWLMDNDIKYFTLPDSGDVEGFKPDLSILVKEEDAMKAKLRWM